MPGLLITILIVSTLILGWMGLRQRRRRKHLGRFAHTHGLRFSARDLFGLTRRYASFHLLQSGHSAHAANVVFGTFHGWHIRLFDYHFEVGHGPHRLRRRYSVIAADLPTDAPAAFVWRDGPAGALGLPLAMATPSGGLWRRVGDESVAATIRDSFDAGRIQSIGVETTGAAVLFATLDPLVGDRLDTYLGAAGACLVELANLCKTKC